MRVADAIQLMKELPPRYRPRLEPTPQFIKDRGLDRTWHWTRLTEDIWHARLSNWPTEFDSDFEEMWLSTYHAIEVSYGTIEFPSLYEILHRDDPKKNHPIQEFESLARIADYFKDGFELFKNIGVAYHEGDTPESHPKFDSYQANIKDVMDAIRRANPNAFDGNGSVTSEEWIRLEVPEETVDIFELYTQLALEALGVEVEWVDSWYYHTHAGGIHCGTNVLRSWAPA
jgi:hypothetical protein